MVIFKTEITIVKIISACAIVQGLGWTVLSFICIVLFYISDPWNPYNVSYSGAVQYYLYYTFLKDPEISSSIATDSVVKPNGFAIFMWIYLLLSASWVALSIDQYIAVHYNKNRLSSVMVIWSTIALVFSIVDVILVSLLGSDYSNCTDVGCYLATGIAMTLAARGFLLWCINVACAFSFLRLGLKIKKETCVQNNVTIPRVELPGSNNRDYRNPNPYGDYPTPPQPVYSRDNARNNKRFG